jgi:hypothetical protein
VALFTQGWHCGVQLDDDDNVRMVCVGVVFPGLCGCGCVCGGGGHLALLKCA